jgi:hypothetical protein
VTRQLDYQTRSPALSRYLGVRIVAGLAAGHVVGSVISHIVIYLYALATVEKVEVFARWFILAPLDIFQELAEFRPIFRVPVAIIWAAYLVPFIGVFWVCLKLRRKQQTSHP